MSLLITSIVLSIALMIVIAIAVTAFLKQGKINKKGYLFVPLGLLGMLLLLSGSFVKINANEVGIIYDDFQGVKENTYGEGFQTKSIFEHITTISTANKTAQLSTAAQTEDSSYATFQITIIYKIESQNAGKFYKSTSSKDISEAQLSSIVKEALQSSTIQFDIYSILGEKLEEVREVFTSNLSKLMMDRYSITVVSASFDDIDAGERIEEIIKKNDELIGQRYLDESLNLIKDALKNYPNDEFLLNALTKCYWHRMLMTQDKPEYFEYRQKMKNLIIENASKTLEVARSQEIIEETTQPNNNGIIKDENNNTNNDTNNNTNNNNNENNEAPNEPMSPITGNPSMTQFHYNIQIHLPATNDISVYNAIFKSLKENLMM